MANLLEKYYSSFGGVDSRSNKLLQDPRTMRKGSKNFRYNFQDELQKANGFQRKSIDTNAAQYGMMEYKYVDVNTGEPLTEILGIGSDGNLYRKKNSTMTITSHGASTSVSIYYDESDDSFKVALNGLGTVTVTDAMTLAQLETALELLAGVAVTISGDNTVKAYLLDCVIADTSFAANNAYYWEVVPFSGTTIPFDLTILAASEGPSYVNLNNVIYITIGQELMKYDGGSIHRAGMPKILRKDSFADSNISGNALAAGSIAGVPTLPIGEYAYRFQLVNVDKNGNEIVGAYDFSGGDIRDSSNGTQYMGISIPAIKNDKTFPVFAAKATADVSFTGSGGTIAVNSGHNIKVNQYLRLPVFMNIAGDSYEFKETARPISFYYPKVTAVTSTSITIATGVTFGGTPDYTIDVKNGQVFNAGYYSDIIEDHLGFYGANYENKVLVGAAIRIWRTKVNPSYDTNGISLSPFYKVGDFPIPSQDSDTWEVFDTVQDGSLIESLDDAPQGEELPRYGKYISSWQGQLVQAGRPIDSTVKDDLYPTFVSKADPAPIAKTSIDFDSIVSEAGLCDYQSFYWSDSATPEGFPQSGLNEQRVDTDYNDNITGIAPNKEAFFAFKERSTSVHTGTLSTGDIVSEILEGSVGCSAHRSIQDVLGSLVWLDKRNGFFSCVAGRLPVNIGFAISDYQKINEEKLDYTTACAATFTSESLYICGVGTTTFVFDFARTDSGSRNCWYIWDRIECKSILATADDELLISDDDYVWKMKRTNTKYDFTDHKSAIDMHVKTAWLNQGTPTIDKHYLAFWINSIQGDFTLDVEQYGNFLSDLISSMTVSFMAETSAKKFVKVGVKAALPKLSSISVGMRNQQKNTFVRLQGWELELSRDFDGNEPKR